MQQKYFSSKVLLFGEYVILSGGNALAIPFQNFGGKFVFEKTSVQPIIIDFYHYLKNIVWSKFSARFDFDKLTQDLNSGVEFKSNIPVGYGLGSSGAVSAAVFDRYVSLNTDNIQNVKNILAQIENFFHVSSSGIDPLVSYFNKPVKIIDEKHIEILDTKLLNFINYDFYLFDSGIPRSTSYFVDIYKNKLKNIDFRTNFIEKIININDQIINSFLQGEENKTFDLFKKISYLEYEYLSEMIISPIQGFWKNSLQDENISVKLCGAGGGGFYLIMAKNDYIFPKNEFEFKLIKLDY